MQAQNLMANLATSYSTILGQMVRQLREEKGYDQTDLANALGVSIMTISRMEAGDTVLDVPQMEKVARFLEIDPVRFFKKSLEIKEAAEQDNVQVLPNKKEINKRKDLAVISVAAVVGFVAGILLSK